MKAERNEYVDEDGYKVVPELPSDEIGPLDKNFMTNYTVTTLLKRGREEGV